MRDVRSMEPVKVNTSYDAEFVEQVQRESGQNLSICYQCGKCTAGCPVSFAYDIPVSQIMRLLQAGQKDTILSANSIWLCASCETCTTRCPNSIDVAGIMDTLRNMAGREGRVAEKDIRIFWESFLDSIQKYAAYSKLASWEDGSPAPDASGQMPT